jgi:hypothetical protein
VLKITNLGIVLLGLSLPAQAAAQDTLATAPCERVVRPPVAAFSESRVALWRALTLGESRGESLFFRSASMQSAVCADTLAFVKPWTEPATRQTLTPYPVQANLTTNSAYPRSVNDAAAWQGVGANLGVTAGMRGQWEALTVSLAPELYYNQNSDFDFVEHIGITGSQYLNPHHEGIDYPHRMGGEALTTLSPGQSYLQASVRDFSATISAENLWIGSAQVYPILMSNTAPGFLHVRLGTQRPMRLPLFDVEFQILFGSLRESDYFDDNGDNNDHYFTTTMAVLQPRFLPGLSIGVARAHHDSASAFGQGLGFYVERLIESPFGARGNREGNGIGVVMGRWVQKESRFEAYAEWSREDTPGDWQDVLREPDWTQAYVLGVQKAFGGQQRMYRLWGEMIHLGESAPSRVGRGFFSYYTHSLVRQGHTNEGQLLGAAIGPGSDAQLVGFDIFTASGRTAFRVERARYDDDTYYRRYARRYGETRHDAEISLAASRTQFWRAFEFDGGLQFSRRYGRQFVPLDAGGPDLEENNWSLRLTASWLPSF